MSEDERDPSSMPLGVRRVAKSRRLHSTPPFAPPRARGRAAPGDRRDKHWWYPLAAAATVALLAVGIAQLTPPERVAPNVTDMAAAPSAQRRTLRAQAAAIDARPWRPAAAAPTPQAACTGDSGCGGWRQAPGGKRARQGRRRSRRKPVAGAKRSRRHRTSSPAAHPR